MSRGNLKAVAKRIRAKHPKNEIIIGDVGRGEREAHEAVRCAGAKVAFLPFTPEITASLNGGKPSNFNDLYRIFAKINAKEQILIQNIATEPENGTTDYKAVVVNDGDILTNNGEEFGESLDVNKGANISITATPTGGDITFDLGGDAVNTGDQTCFAQNEKIWEGKDTVYYL